MPIKKTNNPRCLYTALFAMVCCWFFSCTNNEDNVFNNGRNNTTDVAVTSNISKLGITYAQIDGYVNLNLVTASYSSQRVGIEISTNEDFDYPKRAETNELEGNKLTIVIDTLSANTKYFYRTFVNVNDLNYYGEKRSFVTKDFSNITTTGEMSDLSFTSAKIKCNGNANSIDSNEKIKIGVAFSLSKAKLHPDSAQFRHSSYYGYDLNGYNSIEVPLDSIKNHFFTTSISDLQPASTYYYCSYTRAGTKIKMSEIKQFTTKSLSDQYLSTGDATDITLSSATITSLSTIASLYPQETKILYGVRYAKTAEELHNSFQTTFVTIEGNNLIANLQGLLPETIYYYYTYAIIGNVELKSETKNFKTKSVLDYLKTADVSDITCFSATLNATSKLASIYPNTHQIQYEIRFSTSSNDLHAEYGYSKVSLSQNGDYLSGTATNLKPETTYYYCVVATITDYIYYNYNKYYGNIKSFKTKTYTDNGTAEKPISVTKAIETINNYADNGTSPAEAYVKGTIVSVESYNSQYKSLTYWISDDGTENGKMEVYSGKGLNGADFTGKTDLKKGAVVVVKGTLKKYVNNSGTVVQEFDKNSVIISITNNEPAGTAKKPFTVAQAFAYLDGGGTDNVYVKGKVSKIVYAFDASHKTGMFWISEDGTFNNDRTKDFLAYNIYWLGNKEWTDGMGQVAVGDEVVLCGKLTKYTYKGTTTYETSPKKAYVYSINGKTE